ncbi:hypothetical protein MLD38_020405 [Melastoma candidum]|uniref:Uncharacterized protein n=1 Tax=Melastoma candidum TaxID=119954 RepID=A0ACB9QGM2_9MYRT|nr:hypothetical protein MLD38_020405 [Melastoma candidum]
MVVKSDTAIGVYDCGGGCGTGFREIGSFEVNNLFAATLSPRGTYVQTFQKPASPQEKNVVLRKADTSDSVYQLHQKNMTKSSWPSIRFSSDEAVACRLATNEIQLFDASSFSKGITHRVRIPGVAGVELSKAPGSHVATFVPESKGIPASVQIYASKADLQTQAVARRSFFRCSSVQMSWNNGSTGLLAVAQSDVDKSNQSYYGESKLNYLTIDGTHDGLVTLHMFFLFRDDDCNQLLVVCRIPILCLLNPFPGKDGPIHNVQWSHSGSEFAVVYGFMPANATIFYKK